MVISEAFANAAWPGESAIGKQVYTDPDRSSALTVIGVVANTRNQTLMEEEKPMMYRFMAQQYTTGTYVVVRATPSVQADEIIAAIRAVDPNLALGPVQALADINGVGVLPQRLAASVTTTLGLVLAFIGSRALSALLLGVPPGDPVTFALTPSVLLVIVLIACAGPARRASGVEPIRALRSD